MAFIWRRGRLLRAQTWDLWPKYCFTWPCFQWSNSGTLGHSRPDLLDIRSLVLSIY